MISLYSGEKYKRDSFFLLKFFVLIKLNKIQFFFKMSAILEIEIAICAIFRDKDETKLLYNFNFKV